MVETVTNLVDELRASRALEPGQLETIERELLPRFSEPKVLAKHLLARGWLTPFQIQHVFHGKGEELFLDPYVLLERLGEGGMGQVFKARHAKLGRIVALKVIRHTETGDTRAIERFRREIAAVGKLQHPNVVMAYDADQSGDRLFYVMEFIEGSDLTKLVREKGPMPVRQACDCIRQAALALQHAHEAGLVHRDIKPSNLILSADGRTIKLLDLGLARIRSAGPDGQGQATVTQVGVFIGTPDFVAPEQAVNSRDVDIRADLYSLGCTLYFLLTGEPPFPGESAMDKLIKHRVEEPIRVEAVRSDVPRGVAAMLRKLMAKNPNDRYQTPDELAAVLDPYCRGVRKRVRVKAPPVLTQEQTSPPSSPSSPSARGETSETLIDASPRTPYSSHRLRLVSPRSRRDLLRWGIVGGVTVVLFGMVLLVLANLAKTPTSAQPPIDEHKATATAKHEPKKLAPPLSPLDQLDPTRLPPDARSAWRAAGQQVPGELVAVLGTHAWRHWGSVRSLAVDPEELLAASAGDDGVIRIWKLEDGELLHALPGHGGITWALDFSHDGKLLASGGEDGVVRIWNSESWETLQTIEGHMGPVRALAFPPMHSANLVTGGMDGMVRAWNLHGGQLAQTAQLFDLKAGPVTAVAYSANGRHFAAGTEQGKIKGWDIETKSEILSAETRSKCAITGVAFGPTDRAVITTDAEGKVLLWVGERGVPRVLAEQPGPTLCLAAIRGQRRAELGFVTGRADGELHLLKPDRKPLAGFLPIFTPHVLKGHSAGVTALGLGAPGKLLVSGDRAGVLRVWDLESGQERFRTTGRPGSQGPVRALAFSTDGRLLVSGGLDGVPRLHDFSARRDFEFQPHKAAVTGIDLKHHLVSASEDHSLRLWDANTGREKKQLDGHEQPVLCLAGSVDGQLLASGDAAGLILLWNAVTGNQLAKLQKHEDRMTALAFSPDGKLLLSASWNGEIILWDVEKREPRASLRVNSYEVHTLAFAPDGRTFASAGADRTIHFWETASGKPFNNIELNSPVLVLRYTPDGKRLAFATRDGQVALWDLAAARRTAEWRLPGPALDLAFASDGRHLATANANGTIYVLRLSAPGQK
jgi:WD40 repeat protein/tRNA A-37 threonylcarbamoyl transferase component Bud32